MDTDRAPIEVRLDEDGTVVRLSDGASVRLTGREETLLRALLRRPGAVATREWLLQEMYAGRDEPEAKIVDIFACKVRKKLTELGCGPALGTVRGRGYRWDASSVAVRQPGHSLTAVETSPELLGLAEELALGASVSVAELLRDALADGLRRRHTLELGS